MKIDPMSSIRGVYTPPGDKSITHRAILLNAVAEGTAVIRGALLGADCLATIACMRALGAGIDVDGTTVTVRGARKLRSGQKLWVGNSGTTMRLLTGLLCGKGVSATLDGDASVRSRPMDRILEPLSAMGARISSADGHAPLRIRSASLHGIDYVLPVASAQVKSAILLAGLGASGETRVTEPVPCRNHTELMLENMSADLTVGKGGIVVRPSTLKSCNVRVPADLSSAAFLIALATCLPDSSIVIKHVGINPTRRAIVDVVNAAGGKITLLNRRTIAGERVADLMVESAALHPFEIGGDLIPNLIDEIPVLAVMAAATQGRSVIRDAAELRIKESDRIATTVAALRAFGVRAEATDDGMIVDGGGAIVGGGTVDCAGDHRIAMSAAVAAALSTRGGELIGAECVDVSYPGFFRDVLGIAQ